jgi:hypothetical protein
LLLSISKSALAKTPHARVSKYFGTAFITFFCYLQLGIRKDMTNVLNYDPLDPIECFELHLKKSGVEELQWLQQDMC